MSLAVRWARRRIFATAAVSVVIYYLLSASYTQYQLDTIVPDAKAEDVWEFVADFSKMKQLNPTIQSFQIIADHGNFEHWKYTVKYEELLSHWPYSRNTGVGHYSVRQVTNPDGGQYYSVASTHRTCFLLGFFCLNARGEFKISAINQGDVYCQETVHYQCPFFFGAYCHREVEYQRTAIMGRLKKHFQKAVPSSSRT